MPKRLLIFLISALFLASLSFSLFALSFSLASAQDAIQCTPGDVNLNRNLRFPDSDNIYLYGGKLNFSANDANLYAANEGGLLFRNDSAQIINRSNTIEFQDSTGANFAQFFTGATPALPGTGNLLVNGKIEGLGGIQGSQTCVTGSSPQCISLWNDVNTATYGELRCDGVLGTCANVVATNDVSGATMTASGNITSGGNISAATGDITGRQLCIQGSTCIDSWDDVMSAGGGGSISMTTNLLTIGNGASLRMDPGSTFQICNEDTADTDGDGDTTEIICSTGQGVSKIIAGSGITISSTPSTGNPAEGIGDVMISAAAVNSGWTLSGNDLYATDTNNDVGIGTNNPQTKLQIGDHVFIDETLRIGNFTFICSDNADWTDTLTCGWKFTDWVGTPHYVSGGALGEPSRCDNPFTQPASGPTVAQMQTIINAMAPPIADGLYFLSKVYVQSVSGIGGWAGLNYCAQGGADGNTGIIAVTFKVPYFDIR